MQRRAFTLIELLVVISIIALLIGILLPALGAARRTARQLQNSTQLRGIQQAMVTFAQSNKTGGRDGYFPGLGPDGKLYDDDPSTNGVDKFTGDQYSANNSADTDQSAEGSTTFALLLDGNYFTPEYIIAPSDTFKEQVEPNNSGGTAVAVGDGNYSYAFMEYVPGTTNPLTEEWKETLNTQAIVLGDREMKPDTGNMYSVWTDKDSGDWRGTLTHNDNSTSFEQDQDVENTQYANYNSLDLNTSGGTGVVAKKGATFNGDTNSGRLLHPAPSAAPNSGT